MNLEDVLDTEYGLQQNEWSLTRPAFGEDNQLTVIGWSGKTTSNNKIYILKCNRCSQDNELFGEGYFKSQKGNLVNQGLVPCGCSKRPSWSKEQYIVRCSRKALELGYKFLGFIGDWENSNTKIRMLCEKHGEWSSGKIYCLISTGHGCPKCKHDAVGEAKVKPDDVMIASFFASGAFHPDTKFCRSDRKDKYGYTPYWHISCPECGLSVESKHGHLQNGQRPCACNMHRQQECYINFIYNEDHIIALKFGIANNSKQRIKNQDRTSIYTVIQHSVYQFPNVTSCKKAELGCLQELECGILSRQEMPDGWTETTWVYNLDKIIEIYERNGGVSK
jgi:hypothetical protein